MTFDFYFIYSLLTELSTLLLNNTAFDSIFHNFFFLIYKILNFELLKRTGTFTLNMIVTDPVNTSEIERITQVHPRIVHLWVNIE